MDWKTALGLARSLAIYHGRPWRQRRLVRFYRQLVSPGDLCFDIGAHVGNRSGALLAAGARVVALEPQPVFLQFLRRFLRGAGLTIVGKAVASKPGTLDLHISSRHPTVTTLSGAWMDRVSGTEGFRQVSWDKTVAVDVTTLDALIGEYGEPSFCKIDVEGMEPDILGGLSRPIGLVAFEYLPEALPMARQCIDRLSELGPYRFNAVRGENDSFEDSEWRTPEAMHAYLETLAKRGGSGDIYARLSA